MPFATRTSIVSSIFSLFPEASLPPSTRLHRTILFTLGIALFVLSFDAFSGQVTLAWDPSVSPEVSGYKLNYGKTSGVYENSLDIGNHTSYTLTGLQEEQTYYFSVTAHSQTDGIESDHSNEASTTIPSNPPLADFSASYISGTSPLVVDFKDTSSGKVTAWNWNFGDGSTSSAHQPEHLYSTPGTYTISLLVTGPGGKDVMTKNNYITVKEPLIKPPLTANFSATPTAGEAPLTITFVDTSLGKASSRIWDFGDGGKSTAKTAVYTYTTPGTYSVSLSVSDSKNSDKILKPAFIKVSKPTLKVDFSTNKTAGDSPLEVHFNDNSIGKISAWSWDFGDGKTSSVQNPTHIYKSPGKYTVSLSVTASDVIGTETKRDFISVIEAQPTIEIGEISVDHTWSRIALTKNFFDPVVIANSLSYNDNNPAVVRIRNIDPTGFEIRIQEWNYLDEIHSHETVYYIVIEAGSYTIENGLQIEAGHFNTDNTGDYRSVRFNKAFEVIPVVLTAITSFNEADTATTRIQRISKRGFKVGMQEQELNAQTHTMESIAYIAWVPSSGILDNMAFNINRTSRVVRNEFYTIPFKMNLSHSPVFLSDMQTTRGKDTANIRWNNIDLNSVDIKISEEQSKDSETRHTKEAVGYMLFSFQDKNPNDL